MAACSERPAPAVAPEPAPAPVAQPTVPPPPPPQGAVRIDVGFARAAQQILDVSLTFTPAGDAPTRVWMPVWTPGSYLVREYARNVFDVTARGPEGPLSVARAGKNGWTVGASPGPVTVRYGVRAIEAGVRSAFVDDAHAVLVGAALFLTPDGAASGPFELHLDLPEGWTVGTGLDPHPDVPGAWLARDLDELMDSPLLAGAALPRAEATVRDVVHEVVVAPADPRFDVDRAAEDLARIAEAQATFWGGVPYGRYTVLQLLGPGRGGLEHDDSTLVHVDPGPLHREDAWSAWQGLVSHELFHAWNVRRLRPAALTPYDYEGEQFTTSLWIAEGLTSYYDDLLLVRAGLLTPADHLKRLAEAVRTHASRPASLADNLADSSHDAWVRYYRPDAHAVNHTVSYYRRGALVGLLLDAEIRRRSDDRASLDDVMRAMYTRFPLPGGYEEADFRATASELAGADLSGWFARHVDERGALDLTPAWQTFGLRWAPPTDVEGAWLGATVDGDGDVTTVLAGSPAWEAGVHVGDLLVALDGWLARGDGLSQALARAEAGQQVTVTVGRRGRLLSLRATLREPPATGGTLEVDDEAALATRRRRDAWWAVP
jgi:predicted metalloprotease with PDZ domain